MRPITIFSLLGLAAAPLAAHAEPVNLGTLDEEPNRVQVTTGLEYGLVAGAGYSRVVPFLDRKLVLTGEATLPWASIDPFDYRVRVGAKVPIVGARSWTLAAGLAPIVRGVRSQVSRMTDLGVDVGLTGGYYAPRWFAAGEVGVDLALTTHVTHTDAYRMNVHPDAKDGWYADPGANLRAGVQAGLSVDRYDFVARAGKVMDVDGEAPLIPFYGTVSVAARW